MAEKSYTSAVSDTPMLGDTIGDNLDRRTCASLLWDNLTAPAVITRTVRILKGMCKSVAADLARRESAYQAGIMSGNVKAVSEQGTKYLGWKTRTLAFQAMVEYRLSFALLASSRLVPDGEFLGQRGEAWEANHRLLAEVARRIQDHQNAIGDAFGDADLDLYGFLDEHYVSTAAGPMPLREWAALEGQLPAVPLARAS